MEVLFNAVYTGNLPLLKRLICALPKSEIKRHTSYMLEGTTLLLIAARHGYYDIIKFLIEHCQVDVEQVGEVEFDDETVLEAPPLWCAAAAGNLDCVKLLTEHGANVNCMTYTNSTPLRAACFDGHFEVVKYLVENGADIEIANKHSHTCLMISCFKRHYNIASYLIEQGCQINRQSVKGNTALHDCVESNSLDIMKLLVKNGAVLKRDCFGLTPLMIAAISGNLEIFNYLKSVFSCTIEDEADAYKLLGATYVDKFYDLTEAFKYWKKAANISSKCSKYLKLQKHRETLAINNQSFRRAYGDSTEFKNEQDLNDLLYDPELMRIQAMIIRERILGMHHPETYYFIRLHGASYIEAGDYLKCLSMWMYNLEQQNTAEPLSEITQNSFVAMIELFSLISLKNESHLNVSDIHKVLNMAISQVLVSCNIKPALGQNGRIYTTLDSKLFIESDKRYPTFDTFGLDRQFLIVLHLIGFMCHYQSKMNGNEWNDFKQTIQQFLSCDARSTNSHSLLHIICIFSSNKESLCTNEISLFDVLKFVVDLSPNLNIVDIRGNTPLHFLLENERANTEMVKYLIQAGAHIDLCNENGQTPLDYLKNKPNLQHFKIKYVSLQCLCAQAIIKNYPKLLQPTQTTTTTKSSTSNNSSTHSSSTTTTTNKSPLAQYLSKDLYDFVMDHRRKDFFQNFI